MKDFFSIFKNLQPINANIQLNEMEEKVETITSEIVTNLNKIQIDLKMNESKPEIKSSSEEDCYKSPSFPIQSRPSVAPETYSAKKSERKMSIMYSENEEFQEQIPRPESSRKELVSPEAGMVLIDRK